MTTSSNIEITTSQRASKTSTDSSTAPELIFGLIGALGSELAQAERSLRNQLKVVGYRVPRTIKLSALLSEIQATPFDTLSVDGKRAHVKDFMDAGNELRKRTKHSEAVALLGLNAIRKSRRDELGVSDPKAAAPGAAFIIDSLKHPQEVRALRGIYGPAFIAVAVYTPRSRREDATKVRLRRHYGARSENDIKTEAEQLVQRDEDEQAEPFGQHVSDAFAVADVIVGNSGKRGIKQDMSRFVELLFGDWTHTPRRDEVGIYYAEGSRYRSSSMARQVGAIIMRVDGTIVASGMNDVPKAGGGLYDESDAEADGRDHAMPEHQDASDRYKREVLHDLIQFLHAAKIVTNSDEPDTLVRSVDSLIESKALKYSKFMATIDYVRAVHAEMAALMDAARHGTSVAGCTLYTTTFPCHDCTKHIVAAGVKKVVFVEPYTKSLTSTLFTDSVSIDESSDCGYVHFEPFVGVLPRRYADLFAMHEPRKDVHGMFIEWKAEDAQPQLGDYSGPPDARILVETTEVNRFNKILAEKGFVVAETTRGEQNDV